MGEIELKRLFICAVVTRNVVIAFWLRSVKLNLFEFQFLVAMLFGYLHAVWTLGQT